VSGYQEPFAPRVAVTVTQPCGLSADRIFMHRRFGRPSSFAADRKVWDAGTMQIDDLAARVHGEFGSGL
jgi:hypothetical protein